jgi:hypothetical protein
VKTPRNGEDFENIMLFEWFEKRFSESQTDSIDGNEMKIEERISSEKGIERNRWIGLKFEWAGNNQLDGILDMAKYIFCISNENSKNT